MIRGVGMAIPGPFDYEHGISRMQGLNKYDAIYGIPLEPEIRERVPELKRAAEKRRRDLSGRKIRQQNSGQKTRSCTDPGGNGVLFRKKIR